MIEDLANDLLNEHQRRALSTRLALLDRFFYDVEELLIRDSPRGEMFEVINDISEEQREKVLGLINEARGEIHDSRDRLNLDIRHEYLRRWMAGHLSIFWTILEDCRAAKLSGFGGVSEGLAPELDPTIDKLIRMIDAIKSVIIE